MDKLIENLLKYQSKDAELKKMEDEFNQIEIVVQYRKLTRFLKNSSVTRGEIEKKAEAILKRYNLLNAEINQLQAELQEYFDEIDNCTDESMLEYLNKKFSETERKVNLCASDIDNLTKELVDCKKEDDDFLREYKANLSKYNEIKEDYSKILKSYSDKMNPIKAELLAIEKDIDPSYMKKYKEKRFKKFPVVREVVSDKCPLCRTKFSAAFYQDLSAGQIKECETDYCKIFLYKNN